MRRICMDGYALRITRSGAQDAPVSLGIIKLTLYRQVVDWRVANITHLQLGKGQLFYSVRNTVSPQAMCVGPLIKMIPVCQLKGARLDILVRLVRLVGVAWPTVCTPTPPDLLVRFKFWGRERLTLLHRYCLFLLDRPIVVPSWAFRLEQNSEAVLDL